MNYDFIVLGTLIFAIIMLFSGWFHHHKASKIGLVPRCKIYVESPFSGLLVNCISSKPNLNKEIYDLYWKSAQLHLNNSIIQEMGRVVPASAHYYPTKLTSVSTKATQTLVSAISEFKIPWSQTLSLHKSIQSLLYKRCVLVDLRVQGSPIIVYRRAFNLYLQKSIQSPILETLRLGRSLSSRYCLNLYFQFNQSNSALDIIVCMLRKE